MGAFLWECKELDKAAIGDYLSRCEKEVIDSYLSHLEFRNVDFDLALRQYLFSFRLPGESEKIDRLMKAFSERYFEFHPNYPCSSKGCHFDTIYFFYAWVC